MYMKDTLKIFEVYNSKFVVVVIILNNMYNNICCCYALHERETRAWYFPTLISTP